VLAAQQLAPIEAGVLRGALTSEAVAEAEAKVFGSNTDYDLDDESNGDDEESFSNELDNAEDADDELDEDSDSNNDESDDDSEETPEVVDGIDENLSTQQQTLACMIGALAASTGRGASAPAPVSLLERFTTGDEDVVLLGDSDRNDNDVSYSRRMNKMLLQSAELKQEVERINGQGVLQEAEPSNRSIEFEQKSAQGLDFGINTWSSSQGDFLPLSSEEALLSGKAEPRLPRSSRSSSRGSPRQSGRVHRDPRQSSGSNRSMQAGNSGDPSLQALSEDKRVWIPPGKSVKREPVTPITRMRSSYF